MKRLLILGSVEEFTKLTRFAVDRGIYTVVADRNSDGEAKKYADKAYDVDVSNESGISQIIDYEKIDHILTSYSDYLFEHMVHYSAAHGLPCNCPADKVDFLRDKYKMKQMLNELDIPNKKGQLLVLDHFAEEDITLPYPFVIKPVDGWGSRGVHIVHDYSQLREVAVECAGFSRKGRMILIEELNIGQEMNIMSWVRNGKITFLEFSDREVYGENDRQIPHYARIIHPSVYRDHIIDRVREYLKRIADYIGLKEGPLSTQLFYDPRNDEISIGEVVGRFFGFEQDLAEIINGVNVNTLLLNMAYDSDANEGALKHYEGNTDHYSAVIYIKAKPGIVRDLGNAKSFTEGENIHRATIYAYPGVDTSRIPLLCAVYAHFASRQEADLFTQRMYDEFYIPGLDGENLAVTNKLPTHS